MHRSASVFTPRSRPSPGRRVAGVLGMACLLLACRPQGLDVSVAELREAAFAPFHLPVSRLGFQVPDQAHKIYPYLLSQVVIERPNQVWAADITYLPMAKGFVYLVAILDLYSRKVVAWRTNNTLTSDFCVEALQEAIARFGRPEIFNTDQGSQFTAAAFTDVLKVHDIAISMDGKGRWVDNVFVERLWRSVKYEEVYLHAYETPREINTALTRYFSFYNGRRPHQSLDQSTPDAVYFAVPELSQAA